MPHLSQSYSIRSQIGRLSVPEMHQLEEMGLFLDPEPTSRSAPSRGGKDEGSKSLNLDV